MAEWEIEAVRCQHCGAAKADCSRDDKDYYPSVEVCYATMTRLAWQRDWDERNTVDGKPMYHDGSFRNWASAYSIDYPFHRDDGVTITVSARDDGSWDALVEDGPHSR